MLVIVAVIGLGSWLGWFGWHGAVLIVLALGLGLRRLLCRGFGAVRLSKLAHADPGEPTMYRSNLRLPLCGAMMLAVGLSTGCASTSSSSAIRKDAPRFDGASDGTVGLEETRGHRGRLARHPGQPRRRLAGQGRPPARPQQARRFPAPDGRRRRVAGCRAGWRRHGDPGLGMAGSAACRLCTTSTSGPWAPTRSP